MAKWYYAKNNERLGPVGTTELKALAQTREVDGNTLVWRDGFESWVEARTIKGLFSGKVTSTPSIFEDSPAQELPSDSIEPAIASNPDGDSKSSPSFEKLRHTGAKLLARARTFESQESQDDTLHGERRDPFNLERWKSEIGSVGWAGLIPFRNFFTDKPWTLLWVQFIAFAFGFPFLLIGYYRDESSSLAEAAWAFGIYFAIVWAVLVQRCIRPDKLGIGRIVGTWLSTSVLGVLAVVVVSAIASALPVVRNVFNASESASIFGRLIGMTLGVGLVEETAKLLPVLWFARNLGRNVRPTTVAYLGVISGLAFGATEAIVYSLSYAAGNASSQLGYGDYLQVQLLRLVSLPFLHGIWTGTSAYFAGLSAINPSVRRVVILAGLFGVAALHGLYNTFADGWLGFVLAMLSLAVFIGYVRDEATSVESVSMKVAESIVPIDVTDTR